MLKFTILIIYIYQLNFNIVTCGNVPFDVVYCFENGDCGIKSVGSYQIKQSNDTFRDSIEGHIYEIRNNLFYNVYYFWDVMSTESDKSNTTMSNLNSTIRPIREKNKILVPSNGVRYFDTGLFKTHIVRIYIKMNDNDYEVVDKAVGYELKTISKQKTEICDYLFRICYYDQKYNDNNVKCATTYSGKCDSFYKKSQDDICIDSCITTYYGHLLSDNEKLSPNFNRLTMVKCLIDVQRRLNQANQNSQLLETSVVDNSNSAIITKNSASYVHRLETTINVLAAILSITLIISIVCIFIWARNKYLQAKRENNGVSVLRLFTGRSTNKHNVIPESIQQPNEVEYL